MPRSRSETTDVQDDPRTWSCRQLPFLAVAILWLSAVYAVSRGPQLGVLSFGVGILLLAVPMCLAGICTSALQRKRRLSAMFWRQGWLYALLSRRWLSSLVWTIWGFGMSFLLLLQLYVYEPIEWAALALTIPVFTTVFSIFRRRLVKEACT